MKKEIIKPFDLEAWKNGAKVKTRNGHENITKNTVNSIINEFEKLILSEASESKKMQLGCAAVELYGNKRKKIVIFSFF